MYWCKRFSELSRNESHVSVNLMGGETNIAAAAAVLRN
jgi:hypothetical protein